MAKRRTGRTTSTAAVFGHPLHPMVVPLPIGALSLGVASDVAWLLTGDRFWVRASRWLHVAGIAGALLAAPLGALDFLTMRRVRERPEAWLHAGGNLAAVALSATSLAMRATEDDEVPSTAMALSAATGGLLLITGWLGGELSYRHGIGMVDEAAEARS